VTEKFETTIEMFEALEYQRLFNFTRMQFDLPNEFNEFLTRTILLFSSEFCGIRKPLLYL
jgi:hypothetical protein